MMTTHNIELKEATERSAVLRKEVTMLSAILPNVRGQVIPARRVEARLAAAKDELATLTFWLGMVAESGMEELARLDGLAVNS